MKKSEMYANVTLENDLKIVRGVAVTAEVATAAVVTIKTGSVIKGVCSGTLAGMGVAAVGGCIAMAHAAHVGNQYTYIDEEVVVEEGDYEDIFE